MRHQSQINFFIIFLIALTAMSCVSSGKKLSALVPDITIQLEKTGCLGQCPVYIMTFYSDKTTSFVGKANTLVEGKRTDTLSSEVYSATIKMFEQEQFADLDSAYIEPIVDAPFTYLSFRQTGKIKKVAVRGSAPDSFDKLVDYIEDIARDALWLPTPSESMRAKKEIIIELNSDVDPTEFSLLFIDEKLTLIKKITPTQHYYLFSIECDDPEILLIKIRNEPQVKNAQWNHTLSRREK